MAPMIDMVFLLLVFFMCLNAMAEIRAIELDLPDSEQALELEPEATRALLSVNAQGEFWYEGEPVDEVGLLAKLTAYLKSESFGVVVIRADAATHYAEISRVMAVCSEAGVQNIHYAALEYQ